MRLPPKESANGPVDSAAGERAGTRTYSVEVPDNRPQASIPAIIVFHGGGQEAATIAARWGVRPPAPVPALVQNYLLVFPETHPSSTRSGCITGLETAPSRRWTSTSSGTTSPS